MVAVQGYRNPYMYGCKYGASFYEAVKAVYGPKSQTTHPVRTKDDTNLIKDKDTLSRWAKHFVELLNQDNSVDQTIVDQQPQLPTMSELQTLPTLEEISAAENNLENHRAPGADGIPAEIFKHGGICCYSESTPSFAVRGH